MSVAWLCKWLGHRWDLTDPPVYAVRRCRWCGKRVLLLREEAIPDE